MTNLTVPPITTRYVGYVIEFEGWFSSGVCGDTLQTWCEENCRGPFIVCNLTKNVIISNRNNGHFVRLSHNRHFYLHVKLINEEDIILFKLTWL